jgi:hypothetical protein
MTTRQGLAIAFAGAALYTAAVWQATRTPTDPICKGVRLSEWIAEANSDSTSQALTTEDLQSLGPEGIEYLQYAIRLHAPGETKGIGEWLPDALRKYLPKSLYQRRSYGSLKQCRFALRQLSKIGPSAQPAIPLLVKMVQHSEESLREVAAKGLNRIGPESWDAVEDILRQSEWKSRKSILFTLTSRLSSPTPEPSRAEAERILEIFLDACADPSPEIQVVGVGGLMNCQGFYPSFFSGMDLPQRAGPVIADRANRGEGLVKGVAAHSLYYFPESIPLALDTLQLMAAGPSSSSFTSSAQRALAVLPKTKPQHQE